MATQIVCSWNKFGYCRHKETCRKKHVKEICENPSCEIKMCSLRHPKLCKYYRDHGFCKFDPCMFSHKISNAAYEKLEQKFEENALKISNIEEILANKDEQINKLIDKIDELRNEIVLKINNLEEEISEKDLTIKEIEEKIKTLERQKNNKTKHKGEEFRCSQCDFVTNSQHGLKIHSKKKHTSVLDLEYPRQCDLCDEQCESSKEMKKHMITHSYKEARFKCDECDFVGQNLKSIEVHVRRKHSEKYECGLCDFEAGSSENIEMHLTTCELFECDQCDCEYRCKNLTDIQKHIREQHKQDFCWVTHFKLDRNNSSEISERSIRIDRKQF